MADNRIKKFLDDHAEAPYADDWVPTTPEEVVQVAQNATDIMIAGLEALGFIPNSALAASGLVVPGTQKPMNEAQRAQMQADITRAMVTAVNVAVIRALKDKEENFFRLVDDFVSLLLTLTVNRHVGFLRR